MAAQSTFEAQSFLDHTSAPSSTTTSLATPSAMSTACDGGEGNGRMAESAGTPLSLSLFGVRAAPSVLPELPEPSARVLCVASRGATQTATGNRSRRLVGHRCLEEHRGRRELGRRGHGVQPLHRRDVGAGVANLRAQDRSPPSPAAPPRAGLYRVAGYGAPCPPPAMAPLGLCAAACEPAPLVWGQPALRRPRL